MAAALLADILRVGQAVGAQAIAAYQDLTDRGTTDAAVELRSEKVGRNASCPCGSGRKFKRCCGGGATVAATFFGCIAARAVAVMR